MADAILPQCGIYAIQNRITSKMYVGQSANMKKRKAGHFKMLRGGYHHCLALQRSFAKHGEDAFELVALEFCDPEKLTEREQFWMDQNRVIGLYNMAPAAGSPLGIKRSPETLKKMSEARKGSKASEETKLKMREAQNTERMLTVKRRNGNNSIARITSPENRLKILAANIGSIRSAESRARISNSLKGKLFSEERKARLSVVQTGKTHSAATKEKMRASHMARREITRQKALEQWERPGMRELLSSAKVGTKASEETKQRLSEIALARWSDPAMREIMLRTQMQGKLAKAASK
jgi:group I intron endonuclease